MNSMLYSKDTLSLIDVKFALNSMELRTKLNLKGTDNQANGLFVKVYSSKGRSNERGSKKNMGKSKVVHSQSLTRKILNVIIRMSVLK